MRISYINIFLLIASVELLVATPAPVNGQTIEKTTVTLALRDATLKSVFQEIEKQTEFRFLTAAEKVNQHARITLPTGTYTVKEVLDQVLAGSTLKYEQRERYVLVFSPEEKAEKILAEKKVAVTVKEPAVLITGTVTNANDITIPGVSVVVKGTNTGTVTDAEGRYSINVPDTDAILVFSSIGYVTQEIPVNQTIVINVTMEEDVRSLDEIVVVGYGTQKKVNLTGSVVSIDVDKELQGRAVTDATQILAGLSAGVQVRQATGQPGNDDAIIRIRGIGTLNDASPLIIVDGIESSLSDLNPHDIQTISILKDAASASIYGSRAANGVILVTTKKGREGAPVLRYDGYASIQSPVNLMDLVTNFTEHMRFTNEALLNSGLPATFDFNNPVIANWEENSKTDWRYANTDWYDAALDPQWSFNHNLSLSGGNSATTYLASVGYLDNPGIMKNAAFERYSARLNLETKALDWLTLGLNTFGLWSNRDLAGSAFGSLPSSSSPGVVPISPDGRFGGAQAPGERFVSVNKLIGSYNKNGNNERTKIFSKFYSQLHLHKNLSLESSFAIDFSNRAVRESQKRMELWNFLTDAVTHTTPSSGSLRATNRHERDYRYVINHLLRYSNSFSDVHNVDAIAGYTADYSKEDWFEASIRGLIDESTPVLGAGLDNPEVDGDAADRSLQSFYGRINYNYAEKYLFEANLRYDGSSRFADGRKWGTFPSFSAGWKLSEEAFMSEVRSLDNLTLRASWGQLGNNRIGDYEYQSVYNPSNYTFGGGITSGVAPAALANPVISWEKTEMLNLGLLLNAFNNRLTLEFDWFDRTTKDILVNLPIPGVLGGLTSPRQNVGIVQNKGIDLRLGWVQHIGGDGDLNYGINGNFGFVRNNVLTYAGDNPAYRNQNILLEGHPIWAYYLREVDRMVRDQEDLDWVTQQVNEGKSFFPRTPELGDLVYKDLNADGIYGNDDDRRITDKTHSPNITYGISAFVNWNGFDLSMLWQGVSNVYGYFYDVTNRVDRGNGWTYSKDLAYDHWTPETPNATNPRLLAQGDKRNGLTSDFWLRDASYIKLKNLQIGYSIPHHLISKIGVGNRVRLYASGENLLLLTDWPGMDPESFSLGRSHRAYPTLRQLLFGVNIAF